MRKTVIFIVSFILLGVIIVACDNGKSFQEYMREEKKAIERYIDSEGIVVLNEYPKDSIFKKNEYYKTSEGLYMHVVDPGNTSRRVQTYGEVLVRFEYLYYIKDYVSATTDSSRLACHYVLNYTYFPIEFRYGISYDIDRSKLACPGFAIPLTYVGEGAVVDLIIPSELGNTNDNNKFLPIFYRNLKYTKFN